MCLPATHLGTWWMTAEQTLSRTMCRQSGNILYQIAGFFLQQYSRLVHSSSGCLAVCLSACLSFRLYALMYQYFLTVSLGNTLPFRGSVFIARFLHHARFTKWFDLIVCKWCNHPNGPFLTRFGPPVMHLSCNTILCRAMRGFRMRQPDHLLWAGLWKFLVVLPVEWPA